MATITEDYVSFETAKLLKEKWFKFIEDKDELSKAYIHAYTKEGEEVWGCYSPDYYPCITINMAMKWLREVHKTFISITYENDGIFTANLKVPLKGVDCIIDYKHNCWFTYEEACEAAIKYSLENLI